MMLKKNFTKIIYILTLIVIIPHISSCNLRDFVDPTSPIAKEVNKGRNTLRSTQESQVSINSQLSPKDVDGTIVFIASSSSNKPNYEIFLTTSEGLIFSRLYGNFYGQIALK